MTIDKDSSFVIGDIEIQALEVLHGNWPVLGFRIGDLAYITDAKTIEDEELEIARMQPWRGGPAIFAADGLFGFGAELEET